MWCFRRHSGTECSAAQSDRFTDETGSDTETFRIYFVFIIFLHYYIEKNIKKGKIYVKNNEK